jgi:hypothetical protein
MLFLARRPKGKALSSPPSQPVEEDLG